VHSQHNSELVEADIGRETVTIVKDPETAEEVSEALEQRQNRASEHARGSSRRPVGHTFGANLCRHHMVDTMMWWRRWESNPRPPACKAGALAN
jgi:dissimilatory sulfite reductase (desulfoviridin) alpha/beta subunit